MNIKRKANLNDGCNPELVRGAKFDGLLEIPVISAPSSITIPTGFTPFTRRENALGTDDAICFFEKDPKFAEVKKMGMELDDPSNGIFLRIPGENVSARSRHRGYHSAYTKFVKQELDKININSSVHSIQIQVHALQLKLRELQRSGLPMYESSGASVELWTRYFNKLK